MRNLYSIGCGADSFLKHPDCILKAGFGRKKHLGPDILPLTHKVKEDTLTAMGESCIGHLMSKIFNYLQVLPHAQPHIPHYQNQETDCERTSVTSVK